VFAHRDTLLLFVLINGQWLVGFSDFLACDAAFCLSFVGPIMYDKNQFLVDSKIAKLKDKISRVQSILL
jgi:hypothetical protein